MGWTVTRREMLKLAGGSALGMMFTPVPWKLLGDSAIWTQNRPAIAKLPRGAITFRQTACTLCPLACPVRARCVGDCPVSLTGMALDGSPGRALCPVGLAGHQLPWHPARVRSPRRRQGSGSQTGWVDLSAEAAIGLVALHVRQRRGGQRVMILDDRPGRTCSEVYAALAARLPGGVYVPSPSRDRRPLDQLATHYGDQGAPAAPLPDSPGVAAPAARLVIDPARAEVILSFGAPLLDGYGGPAASAALLTSRRRGGMPRIIAAGPRLTRTASMADRWLPIRPGTEPLLALGIANVLLSRGLVDTAKLAAQAIDLDQYRKLVAQFTPEIVAARTELDPHLIEETARALANGPALVVGVDPANGPIDRAEDAILWGLNLLVGGAGSGTLGFCEGGPWPARAKNCAPPAVEFEDIPDGSVRVLILDGADGGGSLSWSRLSRKLSPESSLVVSLSPWLIGANQHAGVIVPAPAGVEFVGEAGGSGFIGATRYHLAPPLLPPPPGAVEPIDFARRLAGALGESPAGDSGSAPAVDLLKSRAAALHARGRGTIVRLPDGQTVPVNTIASADELWAELNAGNVWIDEAPAAPPARFRLMGSSPEKIAARALAALENDSPGGAGADGYPLVITTSAWSGAQGAGRTAPLLTKLYQESGVRETSPEAFINPATARNLGLAAGKSASVETRGGAVRVLLKTSPGVKPGVVCLALGPNSRGLMEGSPMPDPGVADLMNHADTNHADTTGPTRARPARIREG